MKHTNGSRARVRENKLLTLIEWEGMDQKGQQSEMSERAQSERDMLTVYPQLPRERPPKEKGIRPGGTRSNLAFQSGSRLPRL